MSCLKIKGKKKRSNAVAHHDHAAVMLDNDQSQHRHGLTDAVLQADPILQECTATKENKKDSGSSTTTNHHPGDEEPLVNNAPIFNQEAPAAGGGIVDWMEQAQTILSSEDKQQASTYRAYDISCSVSEEVHGRDHEKHSFDEGLFEGKRFFDVMETIMEVTRSISTKDCLKPNDSSMSWIL